jgi:small nuclear ribonucleoprotein
MVLPLDLLEKQLNTRLIVMLKDGRTMEGKLVGFDQYMNLVLEEADEKNQDQTRKLGTVVLRGNNVLTMGQP